jgi:predicted outer membrane protein
MRYWVAVLGLLLLPACAATDNKTPTSSPASAERPTACPAPPTPDVRVSLKVETPPADRTWSYRKLTANEVAKHTRTAPGRHYIFVSLDMVLDGTAQVNAAGILLAGSKTCLWPTTVEATIRRQDHVHLAAEMVPGSCPDEIMQEFAGRVIADQEAQDAFLKQRIKDVIRTAVLTGIVDDTTDAAKQKLVTLIQTATNKQLKAEVGTYDQRMGEVMRAFEAQQPFARCEKQAWQHLIAG